MIDTKKLVSYLKLLADLAEKTKGDTETKSYTSPITKETTIENIGKAYFTIKVKNRLEKEIADAIKKAEELKEDATEEDWKSLMISVDNFVNIIKTAGKELAEHKELLKLNDKIDSMTHKIIADLYGDREHNRESKEKDEDTEKKVEKEKKDADESDFKKSVESAYLKLMEKLSKVSIFDIFKSSSYKSDEEKAADEKRAKLIDSTLKKLKREVPSEEISEEDAKKLLNLVVRLRETSKDTNFSDAIDAVTKAIAKHLQKAVVKNESETFDAELILETSGKGKRIAISYETWSEDAIEAGDTDDRGWEDEEGVDFTDDENPVKEAVHFLKKTKGATNASSTSFHPGVWYSSEDEVDMKSGNRTIYSYHLHGWTKDEEKQIFDAVVKNKNLTESYYDQANWLL